MTFFSLVELHLEPGSLEEAKKALREVLAETRQFDGCNSIQVIIDRADPGHWLMLEDWASQEQSDAYSAYRAGPGKTTSLAPFVVKGTSTPPTKGFVDDGI